MLKQRRIAGLIGILTALVLMVAATVQPRPAQAAEPTTLFINLTSDDAWTADMALFYAKQVLEMGHPVVLFLNVRAVRLAAKPPAEGANDELKPARASLQALIAHGATVYVCGMCTKRAGMTESDWIEGVKPGSRETIEVQMAPSTKSISY